MVRPSAAPASWRLLYDKKKIQKEKLRMAVRHSLQMNPLPGFTATCLLRLILFTTLILFITFDFVHYIWSLITPSLSFQED